MLYWMAEPSLAGIIVAVIEILIGVGASIVAIVVMIIMSKRKDSDNNSTPSLVQKGDEGNIQEESTKKESIPMANLGQRDETLAHKIMDAKAVIANIEEQARGSNIDFATV